jgi:hypothetical protein
MGLNCKKLIFTSLYMLVACFPAAALETQGFLTEDEIALFYPTLSSSPLESIFTSLEQVEDLTHRFF